MISQLHKTDPHGKSAGPSKHLPILVGLLVIVNRAGLLAHVHRNCAFPFTEQWRIAVYSHLQWRDRVGIAPNFPFKQ